MLEAAKNGQPKLNRTDRRRREREARKLVGTHPKATGDPGLALKAAEFMRRQGRLDEAEAACRRIIADHPRLVEGHIALGTICEQKDLGTEAYEAFKHAVGLDPKSPIAWRRFGRCLFLIKEFDAALIALEKAMSLAPPNLETMLFLGRALQQVERNVDALAMFAEAAERFPDSALLLLEKALMQQAMGQFDIARATLERVIELDPTMVEAHFRLATMGETLKHKDVSLSRLDAMAASETLGIPRRAAAQFAVARIHTRAKSYDEAYEAYRAANDMLRGTVEFNRSGIANYVTVCEQAFTAEVFEAMAEAGSPTRQPVFIVGMPRSGTTLTEQIVSSHRAVGGGGEERKLTQLAEALMREQGGKLNYPRDVGKIEPGLLAPIGAQYLDHMRRRFPLEERITDKNPFNFHHLGLIGILFPNAGIIHCRRDPMDTCLSCYFQYFGDTTALSFTTKLEDIAFFYNQYRRIMEHWHKVLPGRILDVDYEEMVADQEGTSRRIIEHLQLPWDDTCLRFDENERGIRTASQWQVRQPIYKTSVERWRAYDKHLGPLKEGLGIA